MKRNQLGIVRPGMPGINIEMRCRHQPGREKRTGLRRGNAMATAGYMDVARTYYW